MARASRKTKTGTVKVNFKDVESRKTPTEGDYLLEVLEANSGKSGNGNDQIEFIFEIAKGEFKGQKLWFYTPLQENSLWKLHALLTAMGEDVPEDEMDIDLSDLVGKQIVGVLTHETYQGKKRAKMTDFDSVDNYKGGDDEKSDKKSKKKDKKKDKSKKGAKDEPADEPKSKDKKKSADKEEPKSKKDKKPKKISADDVEDMDEDELEALVKKHKLDVDLDDIKKLPKKVKAVIDALEEEDLLEE